MQGNPLPESCAMLFTTLCTGWMLKNILKHTLLHNNLIHHRNARLGFHLGAQQKHIIMTKPIPYKRYGEILFQKVALCYLLHFVQDGSSKSALKSMFSTKVSKNQNSKKRSLNSAPGPPALPGVGGMGGALTIREVIRRPHRGQQARGMCYFGCEAANVQIGPC